MAILLHEKAKNIWSFGGGKGGTGKTVLVANMGIYLARLGGRVLIVDADFGGANLHTCLGIDYHGGSICDFLRGEIKSLGETILDTGFKNLKLLSGSSDPFDSAILKPQEMAKFIKAMKLLDFDYILIDLGSGTSRNVLDLFLSASIGVLVMVPEPTSIEGLYRFLRSLIFHIIKRTTLPKEIRNLIKLATIKKGEDGSRSPLSLIREIEEIDKNRALSIKRRIQSLQLKLVLNKVRSYEDIELGFSIRSAWKKYFGTDFDFIGYINNDDRVKDSVRLRRPLMSQFPNSNSTRCIESITNKLITKEQLSFDFI
jgi:flagellar biosynthesis protein FlhG